jgi:antitoxin YefM
MIAIGHNVTAISKESKPSLTPIPKYRLRPLFSLKILKPPVYSPGFAMYQRWQEIHRNDPGHRRLREALSNAANGKKLNDAPLKTNPIAQAARDLDRKIMAIILTVLEAIVNDISRYVPITKAKNDLLDLIRQIESVDESVAVTKNGVPAAVILSMEKYAGLLETIEILSDEDTAKSLRASIRQARKGKWLRADEVFRR